MKTLKISVTITSILAGLLFSMLWTMVSVFALEAADLFKKPDQEHALISPGEINVIVDLPNLVPQAKKLEMVLLPAGEFIMGQEEDERHSDSHSWPAHRVYISRPLYIAKYEITQAQYEAVMGEKSHHSKIRGIDHPVEKVSWIDCRRFIDKLNKTIKGLYRLPTEAEWEYACRAGSQKTAVLPALPDSAESYIWYKENSDGQHHPVGSKKPNAWGLYDMLGNVSEWCADRYQDPYERDSRVDPLFSRPDWLFLAFFTDRVNRGGSFYLPLQQCTPSIRHHEQAFDFHYSLGFRIVMEIPEE